MNWTSFPLPGGGVVIVFQVRCKEADEILTEMTTGDESPAASKQAFMAFLAATRRRPGWEHGTTEGEPGT
jgi:hypothetical protein